MNCKVQGVFRNLRYRILTIDGEEYIMDMGHSFWKIIFPFFFWLLPNPVFKVNDPNIAEKLKSPEVNKVKTGYSSILGGGIGVLLATLLKPIADYFALPDTPLINAIILSILVVFELLLFVSLNNKFKKKLRGALNLKDLTKDKLWIRPQSFKHFFQVVVTYLFVLALTFVLFYFSIVDSDIVTLLFAICSLFFLLIIHALTATVGHTTVKFKGEKKTAV
ncbi:DUF443 family protein [Virgibacillus dakarensis]|uniref:DUF443 family protein n=1 Tax=Virgibacillus dakarensis TaxID=1917889 RepID=UPI000B42EB4A|nr:DUF443 family protein [Virgibacillus dakarensis]MTW86059.1 DUF443 family protein [Virgibacillus dakarensis]